MDDGHFYSTFDVEVYGVFPDSCWDDMGRGDMH